ncbi:uncharacterized protein BT62DRAFT_128054 [Guyanagaster necrorhizus]|uniref:RBR-type E3 ubiquitin transferase n=1 Tax=Guyanagaster necrorhizus TaxID=856835 RepID=A0A9P7VTU1_9AGAR|nr:uncharacterized protein BT62DRAFT_128054 [Guyanagaster necrorhizus MCA 3950]KAG7446590.1 hypothetical protein BT62DRAFT_128054 [Guyanagaster necrorhizus MCA 3950]
MSISDSLMSATCAGNLLNTRPEGAASLYFGAYVLVPAIISTMHRNTRAELPNPKTCQPFLRGSCRFGDSCRLSHQERGTGSLPATSSKPTLSPSSPCIFFVQGMCKNGGSCTFLHVGPSVDPRPIVRGGEPAKAPSVFAPCRFFLQGKCTKGQECPFPHPEGHNPVCAFHAQGQCRFGSNCSFSHDLMDKRRVPIVLAQRTIAPIPIVIGPGVTTEKTTTLGDVAVREDQEIESEVVEEAAEEDDDELAMGTEMQRSFFHCKALFGPGANIQSITTSFESRTVVISTIPDDQTQGTLIALLEPFGRLSNIAVTKDAEAATARATFFTVAEASAAVRGLAGSGMQLKMDLKAVESGAATLRSTKVKVAWFAPRRIGWAHYTRITDAKKNAERLNGSTFNGYKLEAKFQTPSIHQTTSFSVEIKGLPMNTIDFHLREYCGNQCKSVMLKEAAYDRQSSLLDVEEQLKQFGTLDSFDVLPEDKQKSKITAFAQFINPDDAAKAVEQLQKKPQSFLNRSPMWLELIHAVKYNIPYLLFVVIKASLEEQKEDHPNCNLKFYDRNAAGETLNIVCVRLFSSDPKSLGQLKDKIEKILDGRKLMDRDGKIMWDDFFMNEEGKQYLEEFNDAHILCDSRKREIHVYGDAAESVINSLRIKCQGLKSAPNIISLDRAMLSHLIKGGLEIMQERFGRGNCFIDFAKRSLMVKKSVDIDQVRKALATLDHRDGEKASDDACPVCWCEITNPITLKCGHSYCKECLQHMLLTNDSACPSPRCVKEVDGHLCDEYVDVGIIRKLLSPEQENRLLEVAFLAHIHVRPEEFRYCPTPDCQVVYRPANEGTVLVCPSCWGKICAFCHVQFHEGLSCKQHRENMEGGYEAFQRWKAEHGAKECPNCKAVIEKNGGCNHVTCARCHTHICWVCMKTFRESDGSSGVYSHLRKEHGSIS